MPALKPRRNTTTYLVLLWSILVVSVFVFSASVTYKQISRSPAQLVINQDKQDEYELRPVFFTIVNNGFLDIAKNWMLSLEAQGMTDYVVVCVAVECYDTLRVFGDRGHHIQFRDAEQYLNDTNATEVSAFASFGSLGYWTFIRARSKLICEIYLDLYNEHAKNSSAPYNAVFFLDADTVINQPVVQVLQDKYIWHDKEQSTMFDIVLSVDCNDRFCDFSKAGSGGYCMGLVFIPFSEHGHNILIRLLKGWRKRIDSKFRSFVKHMNNPSHRKQNVNDQREMNFELQSRRDELRIGVLDWHEFPSGWLMQQHHFRKDAVRIFHANFIHVSKTKDTYQAKVDLFKANHRWFLDQSAK